jgi:hypothetical protein
MFLPPVYADSGKKGDIYAFAAGVPVVVDNNVDVTYTGKTWKDNNGNNKYEYIARISQAPIYNDDGSAVDCSWHGTEDAYVIVNNVFSAQVIGAYITTTYQGQSMSWNPIVMVDSKEYVAKGSPRVLAVDPINSNYLGNTLEWDYGVCVRRVRVIEGLIQETWIFDKDPKGTVWIKDNAQKSAGFTWAIAPYAYDANNNAITINQYKQVMASDMAKATYPVTIDPTEVYVTSASDCSIFYTNADYNTSNNATDGTIYNSNSMAIGQNLNAGQHNINRAYLYFDTSSLPDLANISNVNVSVYGAWGTYSTTDFTIFIQNGMPTYPHDSPVTGDYNKLNYAGIGNAGYSTSSWTFTGYNNISMNSTGISWIQVAGWTKLCLRSSRDISMIPAGGSEFERIYSYEQGAGYRPYLEVTYSSSGVPTVTTNPATYVTKTTAQLNGYVNADGGETDTVSFNYQHWYNAGWLDCIEFTINASYVDANLTNFPVLVAGTQLNTTDTDFWTTVNSSGSDILFTASDGVTKLNRELVSINTTAKTMECYVNVTAVSGTVNTKFYMYYNSSNIALYNESNSTATWDNNYVLVLHMNDNPNTSTIQDSTIYNNDGTKNASNNPIEISGLFTGDMAQSFDGANDFISLATSFNTSVKSNHTGNVEVFINRNVLANNDCFFSLTNSSDSNTYWRFFDYNNNKPAPVFANDTTSAGNNYYFLYTATSLPAVGVWTQSAIQSDNTSVVAYMDSIRKGLIGANNSGQWFGDLRYGVIYDAFLGKHHVNTGGGNWFNGSMTEFRYSNTTRADAWMDSSYHSFMQPTLFAPVTDVFTTTSTQSKNTGDSWYTSQTGLTANYLYGYKAEAVNSYGMSWGAWVWFNTSVTLNPPSNVLCNAGSDSISLSWTKGGNGSYTYIRYKVGSYPTSSTDGNAVANQSGVNFTHTGLASGTSYYYRLWGEDGGTLSTTNVTTMCTTTAGGTSSTPPPLPTVNFSGGTTTPNGSALTNNPLYTLGNQEAAAISVPQGTWWMLVGLGILIVTGLFIFTRSRNLLLSLGAMIIAGVVMANMGMFPIWIMWVFGLAGIGMSWKELR